MTRQRKAPRTHASLHSGSSLITPGLGRPLLELAMRGCSGFQCPWNEAFDPAPRAGAVWAIVVNNFTFHYAFYVVMNWLPTYFDKVTNGSRSGRRCALPRSAALQGSACMALTGQFGCKVHEHSPLVP